MKKTMKTLVLSILGMLLLSATFSSCHDEDEKSLTTKEIDDIRSNWLLGYEQVSEVVDGDISADVLSDYEPEFSSGLINPKKYQYFYLYMDTGDGEKSICMHKISKSHSVKEKSNENGYTCEDVKEGKYLFLYDQHRYEYLRKDGTIKYNKGIIGILKEDFLKMNKEINFKKQAKLAYTGGKLSGKTNHFFFKHTIRDKKPYIIVDGVIVQINGATDKKTIELLEKTFSEKSPRINNLPYFLDTRGTNDDILADPQRHNGETFSIAQTGVSEIIKALK